MKHLLKEYIWVKYQIYAILRDFNFGLIYSLFFRQIIIHRSSEFTKTSQESQNAALRTSHRLSNVSNCSFVQRLHDFSHYCYYCHYYNFFLKLFQYFWKVQFDTFDSRCDFLRAAFCDSRNVFQSQTNFSPKKIFVKKNVQSHKLFCHKKFQ